MPITLDPATEQRIQHELSRGPYRDANELLNHALDLLSPEEDWLYANREAIQAALEESFAAKERGELYTPEQAEAMLNERRAARSRQAA